jgi:hypothetical protein
MQRILCLTLLLALLINVSGCPKQQPPRPQWLGDSWVFEVDGVEYWIDQHILIDRQENVASSFLIVSHYSNGYKMSKLIVSGAAGGTPANSITTVTLGKTDEESVAVKTNTLYFVPDKKIEFEKSYQELGIDSSQLHVGDEDNENKIVLNYLQPILEKLIRENVKSQESEGEAEP